MTSPVTVLRKVGEIPRFWVVLVAAKFLCFCILVAAVMLVSHFQKGEHPTALGAYSMSILALLALLALFFWDFLPAKRCPQCRAKMKKVYLDAKNPPCLADRPTKNQGMILCCKRCHTFIDLNVTVE